VHGKEEKGRKGEEKVGKAFSSDFGQTLRPMPLLFGKPILYGWWRGLVVLVARWSRSTLLYVGPG